MLPPCGRRAPGTPDLSHPEHYGRLAYQDGGESCSTPPSDAWGRELSCSLQLTRKKKALRPSSLCPFSFPHLPGGPHSVSWGNSIYLWRHSSLPTNVHGTAAGGEGGVVPPSHVPQAAHTLMGRLYPHGAPQRAGIRRSQAHLPCWLTSAKTKLLKQFLF